MTTPLDPDERLEMLEAALEPVQGDDDMAEAGRKILLKQFITMLQHEAGSKTGEDIEDVHDMRVAIRRMRSTFSLLESYYKPKAIQNHLKGLRKTARVLGSVRDLDVLITNMTEFQATLDEDNAKAFQSFIDTLDEQRTLARHDLVRYLNKGEYQRFITHFSQFLLHKGSGARSVETDGIQTNQVRFILPTLLYSHLGQVRAYDDVIADADAPTLHALRIEFKRLRYIVALFSEVLGTSINDFVKEIKVVQDHLGRMNDIDTAQIYLQDVIKHADENTAILLTSYLGNLEVELGELRGQVDRIWKRFNTRTVQKQLANAIAAL